MQKVGIIILNGLRIKVTNLILLYGGLLWDYYFGNMEKCRHHLVVFVVQAALQKNKNIIGEILDGNAIINLFFTGKWPTTSFFFRGMKINDAKFLVAQTIIYLHQDCSVPMATDILSIHAMLPIAEPKWPSGLDIF